MPANKKPLTKILLPAKLKAPKTAHDLRAFRHALGLTQHDFWPRLGVTQSGGSRHEKGRRLPPPAAMLLDIVYVKGVTPARLTPNDFAILELLKTQHPDLYNSLDKAAKKMDRFLD
jgi:DNA-binding transcriptional regulator YiaG